MPEAPRPHHNFVLVRSDGRSDKVTALTFESYDAAYDELERYYRDFCCSDDEKIEYTITSSG
jgi:hypothetical protein